MPSGSPRSSSASGSSPPSSSSARSAAAGTHRRKSPRATSSRASRMAVIRALLFTDVVDSTKLAATLGDAATATLWAAHDRLARDLLRDSGGREIDKSDGMLLLFDTASDAVRYAFAYHGALRALEP